MNIKTKLSSITFFLLLVFAMGLAGNHLAQAQPGDLYDMTGSVGAGGMASAGNYQTDVVIGQAAIASHAVSPYQLGSGFWGGGLVVQGIEEQFIFLPIILR